MKPTRITNDYPAGRTIVAIRLQTTKETASEGWYEPALVMELDDGSTLYASQDYEGNGPGAMFGTSSDGRVIALSIPSGPSVAHFNDPGR